MTDQDITFIVGSEKKLKDIMTGADAAPLLAGAVSAGARKAAVRDTGGGTLWEQGGSARTDGESTSLPLVLEGEPVGSVVLWGARGTGDLLRGIAGLLRETLTAVLNTNLKRMLSTELHTSVVNLSQAELLETNARLRESEAKYRALAENLEKKVAARSEELQRAHARLLQQEKMASIGQLAAGVAHEINNPLGFIASNLHTLEKYLSRIKEMLGFYQASLNGGGVPGAVQAAQSKWRDLRLDFVLSDTAELISQNLSGAERVKKIVSDLRGFSHVDDAGASPVDINAELDKTLNVLGHEIPASARIERDYGPLPPLTCNAALLCQVFLNIVLNALQAKRDGLVLSITTRSTAGGISIRISDNGPGIPDEIRARVFDPFFTTKDVGGGTGMGLTVAYDIIKGCHGVIRLDDAQPGKGASFLITLPTEGASHVKIR